MAGGRKMGKILEKLDEVSEQVLKKAITGKEEQPSKKMKHIIMYFHQFIQM